MNSGKRILITGGSGLIGSHLTAMLLEKGYTVAHLGRKKNPDTIIKTYLWDPSKNYIDENALMNADHVIHLAGENIAEHRWTKKNKRIIIESRTISSALLYKTISIYPNIISVTCASGIGIYKDQHDKWVSESSEQSNSFPALTCKLWEEANYHYTCRSSILRTGIVLTNSGGALPELIKTKKFGVIPFFGNGKFYQSWIHINDLCNMYIYSIENTSIKGIYNAVAPGPVTNLELSSAIRKSLQQFVMLLPVPKILLKIILGQKSIIVTEGCRVSPDKIIKAGFQFSFPEIGSALSDILKT